MLPPRMGSDNGAEGLPWHFVGRLRLAGRSEPTNATAFLVAPRVAMTCAHVLERDASVSFVVQDSEPISGRAFWADTRRDLALVALDGAIYSPIPGALPHVEAEMPWTAGYYEPSGSFVTLQGTVMKCEPDRLLLTSRYAPSDLRGLSGAPIVIDGRVGGIAAGVIDGALESAPEGIDAGPTIVANLSPALWARPQRLLAEPTIEVLLGEEMDPNPRSIFEHAAGRRDSTVAGFLRSARERFPAPRYTWGDVFASEPPELRGLRDAPSHGYLEPGSSPRS